MKFRIFHNFLFSITCTAILLLASNTQLSTATDVTTLPFIAKIINASSVELPRTVPSHTYRVLINDYYHLSCLPATTYENFNARDEAAKEWNRAPNQTGCATLEQPSGDNSHQFVHHSSVEVGFAGSQQLRLFQKPSFKWQTVGDLPLTAVFREQQIREMGPIESGLYEEKPERASPIGWDHRRLPLNICRSGTKTFQLGILSLIDGVCRVLDLPESGVFPAGNWSHLPLTYAAPIQLALKAKKEQEFRWEEVAPAGLTSGDWTAPPGALEVETGGYGRHFRPLYIARLTINASDTTVIGLFGGTRMQMAANPTAKVELLVDDSSEAGAFQVRLILSGRHNPVNVLAPKWKETLNCKLEKNKTSTQAADEVQLLNWKVTHQEGADFGGPSRGKEKSISWKIYRKTTALNPYWGAGFNGSHFAGNSAAFVGESGTNFWDNTPERLPRHLCRMEYYGPDYWVAGFLDHSEKKCIASIPNGISKNVAYEVLYDSPMVFTDDQIMVTGSSAEKKGNKQQKTKSRLVWTPYRVAHAQQLGAIIAGWEASHGRRSTVFFARIKQFSYDGNRTFTSLYGTIEAGSDKFIYPNGVYDDTAQSYTGAEAVGLEVLALEGSTNQGQH